MHLCLPPYDLSRGSIVAIPLHKCLLKAKMQPRIDLMNAVQFSHSLTRSISAACIATSLFHRQNLRVLSSFIALSGCWISSDHHVLSISIYADRSSMARKKMQIPVTKRTGKEYLQDTRRRKLQSFVRNSGKEDYMRELSVWDSNAEDVRMDRSRPSYPSQSRLVKEWGYEAVDASCTWQTSLSEEENEYLEDDGGFQPSIHDFDMRSVLGFLGLVFPAVLAAVPWLFSNSQGIMMALVLLPAASRVLAFPFVVQKSLSKMFQRFDSKPKRKRNGFTSRRGSRSRSASDSELNWGHEASENVNFSKPDFLQGPLQSIDERPVSSGNQAQKRPVSGGWDDLVPIEREILKPILRTKVMVRRLRKEQPLYLRLLVALFPFLGYWGGFL